MTFWLDAQLPLALAAWLAQQFSVEAQALRDLGLRDATDATIFLISDEAQQAHLVSHWA